LPSALDARDWAASGGLRGIGDSLAGDIGGWNTRYPGRPGYFTHWGEAFRHAASVMGLPLGDYRYSRPPQGVLPEAAKDQIRAAYEKIGFARQPVTA
jgi:4-hydroxy-tetrahydrodipicolinate synthase